MAAFCAYPTSLQSRGSATNYDDFSYLINRSRNDMWHRSFATGCQVVQAKSITTLEYPIEEITSSNAGPHQVLPAGRQLKNDVGVRQMSASHSPQIEQVRIDRMSCRCQDCAPVGGNERKVNFSPEVRDRIKPGR